MREPGQVADDRADRRAAPASRREHLSRNRVAAHLVRALTRELENLPVEEEEPGEPERVDQRELLVEPSPRLALVSVQPRVALGERTVADALQLRDSRLLPVREVRIAVAELLRQVELKPLGELDGARDSSLVVRETRIHLLFREQHALVVAATLALRAVERRAMSDRHQRVLQADARAVVRVRIPRRDGLDTQLLGKVAQRCVAPRVAALVGTLQLD